MLENYDGYEWGWICSDGTRQESGGLVTGGPPKIVGIWGKLFRTDITRPFYFETSRQEEQELAELMTVNMQQCIRFAYPEDYPMTNKVLPAPTISVKNFRILQRWRCKECDHTFYTELLPRLTLKEIWKHLRSFDFSITIECEICKQISCNKNGKVKKEVQS